MHHTVKRNGLVASVLASLLRLSSSQSCQGQSCTIADLSGSTGQPYTATTIPVFPEEGQECCIIAYNPQVEQKLYAQVPGLEAACPTQPIQQPAPPPDVSDVECRPKTLVFATGTTQPTDGGGPVGMAVQDALNDQAPGQWFVQGVPYTADVNGINCLGLAGGITAKQTLAAIRQQCPDTALFAGGYSQGAMVIHDAVANTTLASQIPAVLVFGDPYNGAPIKGYNGPIHTICNPGDFVCQGLPRVTHAHTIYGQRADEAAMFLESVDVPGVSGASPGSSSTAVGSSTQSSTQASTDVISSASSMASSSELSTRADSETSLQMMSSASSSVGGSSTASATSSMATSEGTPSSSVPSSAGEMASPSSNQPAGGMASPSSSQPVGGSNGSGRVIGGFQAIFGVVLSLVAAALLT